MDTFAIKRETSDRHASAGGGLGQFRPGVAVLPGLRAHSVELRANSVILRVHFNVDQPSGSG